MISRASLPALLAVAALGLGACGGGKRQAPSTPSAPAPPTTPSTATATTFTPGVPGSTLPPSTPLASSTYRDAYIKSAVGAGTPTSLAPQIADCVIAKLGQQGVTTVGGLVANQAELQIDTRQCVRQAAGQ